MATEAETEEKNSETIGQNQADGDTDATEPNSVLSEKIKDDAPSSVTEGKSSASEGEVFIEAPSEDKATSEQMFVDGGAAAKEKISECREHLEIDEKGEFEEAKDEVLKSKLPANANSINDLPTEQTTDESSKMDGKDETDALESQEERDLGKSSEEYRSPEKVPILEVKEKYPQNDEENTKKNAEEQQSSEDLGLIVRGKDKEEKITESSNETPTEQQTRDSKIDTFPDTQLSTETQSVYEKKEPEETAEISEALPDKGHHYENSADQGGVELKTTTSNEEEIQHNEDREQQSEVESSTDCMNPEKASVDEHSKATETIESTNTKSDGSEKEKAQPDILVKSEEHSDAVTTEATVGLEKVQDKPEESTVEQTLVSETEEGDETGETKQMGKETIDTEGPAASLEEACHDASPDVPNEQTKALDGLSEEVGFASERDENMGEKDDCARETAQDFLEETSHTAGKGVEETDAKNIGSEDNDRDVEVIPAAASQGDDNAKTPDNTCTNEITIAVGQEDDAMTKISSVKGDSEPTKVEDEYVSNTVGDASETGEPTGKPADIDEVLDDAQGETIGSTCDEQHQENVENNEKNGDGEQGEEEHQTLQQEELVSEVENQETTSTTGANKMEISKEGENLMNMISESVKLEEAKIENETDNEKINESVEDNPRDHALPSQTIHDAADEDHAEADQSSVGKDGNIVSLEKESIKSKGPDEGQPRESEANQSLADIDNNIVILEKESIESKGPDNVQHSESEATKVGNIGGEEKPKVAEIVSTSDDAETTSIEGGESVDVDKDKAEYQEHKNVSKSMMEEQNQREANETQMTEDHEIPQMDDLSPEKSSETNELVMKDIHDKTKRRHEEEADFASNKPINQTTMPEQSRIPEEENTIMENKTESSFPKDAIEHALKSDPEEQDEEMLRNEESSHIFPESSHDTDHNIVEGLSHQDEGNKICEDAAPETASSNQSCEANEEQRETEKPERPTELKQDMPTKYFGTLNSQEETLYEENPDNVKDSEKCEGKDETAVTLERASAADSEEPSHRLYSNCEEISDATNLGDDSEPDSASKELLRDNIESNESKENDKQREEKFQNPHDIESELEIKKEETTSEEESTKVSEPVDVDEDTKIANTMDDESVKENVEDNLGNNAVPPQTKHDAVDEKHQETGDSSIPLPDKGSTETQGLDSTEEPLAEVQTAEAEDTYAGYIQDKHRPEVPESAGINDDSETASTKKREDTQVDNSNINDALIEESNEIRGSFYEEKAHQVASTIECNEDDVNEDKTDYQEHNKISESIAEEQNQEKENVAELTKNSKVCEVGDITEDPESAKTKDENLMQENICSFLETQELVIEEVHDKVDKKHEEVPISPCENQIDQTSTTEGNVDFGRNKEKLNENLEAQKESIIVPQEKNQIVVPEEKSRDTIGKTETDKIDNLEEGNTNCDETSGSSFVNSMAENNLELALKEEKEEEIPKDEEISHILPETAEVIPEKQILGDDGSYEDPGCSIVEKMSQQDESSICQDAAPETILDNQNKEAKENLEDATREEAVESAAENIKERELETTENIEEKEAETEIQTSETNEIKDAAYKIPMCEEIYTHDESTNIAHQDEDIESVNNKDEGNTFQKIDNTPITTSLANEAALEYSHESQKELGTMADTEQQSRLPRNKEDDSELTTTQEQILEATTEVGPAEDEISEDQNYKLESEDSEVVNPKKEEMTSKNQPTWPEETEEGIGTKQEVNPKEEERTNKILPTLPEETEEGTETKQEANPNHDEETHEHEIKNNVNDLDTPINGNKSEEPAEPSAEILEEPSRAITTETGVVAEKGLMEGEVTTSEETNKLVSKDLDPQNNEKVEPPLIRALDEPVFAVTTSEETDKLVSKDLDPQNEKGVESPQIREKALDEQIATPTHLVTTTEPVSTAKEDDAVAEESLKNINQEAKDFNLVSEEHVQEQAETDADGIQPPQDETTAEDALTTKELNNELEISAPAVASEDQIHDIGQATETTNETTLEKENKEHQEVEGNSEAKSMDGQDQQEIKRKQLIANECEPTNIDMCSKEIEDTGAIFGVTQDNRNKEPEVHKSVETKEMECEKQDEQRETEVFKANEAIYKDETSKEESDPIGDRIGTSALEYEDKSSCHHNEPMHVDDTRAGVVTKEEVESAADKIKERELETTENIEEREVETVEIQTSETNEIKDAADEAPQRDEICTRNEDDSELTTSKEQNLEATTEVDSTRDEMSEDQNYKLANEESETVNPKEEETASKIQTVLALPEETKEGIETNQEANPNHGEETRDHVSKNNTIIDLDTLINGNKSEEPAQASSAEIIEEQSRAVTAETEVVAEKGSMEGEVTTFEKCSKLVSEDIDPQSSKEIDTPQIRVKALDEPIVEVTSSEEANKSVPEDLDAQNDKEAESPLISGKAADEPIATPTKEDDAAQEESLKSIDQEAKDLNLESDEHVQEKAETNPEGIQLFQDETTAEDASSTNKEEELRHELEMSAPAIASSSDDQIHQIEQASETTNETVLEEENKEYREVEGDSEAKETNGQDQEEINRKQLIGEERGPVNTNERDVEIEDGEATLGRIQDDKNREQEVHESAETKEIEYEKQEEETATEVTEADQPTYKDEPSAEESNVIGESMATSSAPEYENKSSVVAGVVAQKEIAAAENEIFEEHENQSKNKEPDEELKPKETDAKLNENPTDKVNEADAILAEKDITMDEKTEEDIITGEMSNDFATKEMVGSETVSKYVSTNWETVSEALKANIMTLDDNEKDKDVTDKIVNNLGIEKGDTSLVVLSEKEIPEKLSTNEAIEDTQNEKESFPLVDTRQNEDKRQSEQDVLPASRYLMDRILQEQSGTNDETLEVESEDIAQGKTVPQIVDDAIISKREEQDIKSAKDTVNLVEEHAHDPEKSIEKSLENNDGIKDNNPCNAPRVAAVDEDAKADPEKEVDAEELKSKELLQDDKIPITGPQVIETAIPKASEEDAPNEGEKCGVEILSDIPKDGEVANETPEQKTSSLSEPADDATRSIEIPQKSHCHEPDYSTKSTNDKDNMPEEAPEVRPKSVEVGNKEVERGQIPKDNALEVLKAVPEGLKDETGEENQRTITKSQPRMTNVDLPEDPEVSDSQNIQKPDTKIGSVKETSEQDEKCSERINAAKRTEEKQSDKVENAVTKGGESDGVEKDKKMGGDEHKSDDFGQSTYIIVEDSRSVEVENEEGKQDKISEDNGLETLPREENAENGEAKRETTTESETMMTKVDFPDEPEVSDSQKVHKLDTQTESAKEVVEPDEKCSEAVNLPISTEEKQSERVISAISEEEKTDHDDDDEKGGRRGEDEHKAEDTGNNAAVIVKARDAELKPTHKKSHNILSGVGSKVKHSLAKVKKAITGKSSHPKTVSPR